MVKGYFFLAELQLRSKFILTFFSSSTQNRLIYGDVVTSHIPKVIQALVEVQSTLVVTKLLGQDKLLCKKQDFVTKVVEK